MTGPAERADALRALDILDSSAEQAFDDIVEIASQICETPIALISLLDVDRQWFKARVGLEAQETPISQSVCSIDADDTSLLQICDLSVDPRTRDNPLVTGGPEIRFYAGAPLVASSGVVIGRLCVIDTRPRPEGLNQRQVRLIEALARQVAHQLDARRIALKTNGNLRLQEALMQVGEGIRASRTIDGMTAIAAALVGDALQVDRSAFGLLDLSGEVVTIGADWTDHDVQSIAGVHRFDDYGALRAELVAGGPLIIDDVETDRRTRSDPSRLLGIGVGALVNMPVRERDRTVAIFIVHNRKPRHWTDEEILFLRNVADRLQSGVSRQQADEQQKTLNGEISHRLKNMLAMVQAIAIQTFRGLSDRTPIEQFELRLLALSAAQDVLMQNSWKQADLAAIISASIAPFGCDGRVDRTGPPLIVGPRSALSVSLLVHELMTNALKYGALSSSAGRVAIDWSCKGEGKTEEVNLSWTEIGGPEVVLPERRGFGSRIIKLGLAGTGGTNISYPSTGLEIEFRALLKDLSAA